MKLNDKLDFPDPTKFGTSRGELERLGAWFQRYLRSGWSDLTPVAQARLEARLRMRPVPTGVDVYFDAATKHALAGNLNLAGQHYRRWLNVSYLQRKGLNVAGPIRRQVSASRASQSKRETANQRFRKVADAAGQIVNKRRRPISANELARQVGLRVEIPHQTVRRILRGMPAFKLR